MLLRRFTVDGVDVHRFLSPQDRIHFSDWEGIFDQKNVWWTEAGFAKARDAGLWFALSLTVPSHCTVSVATSSLTDLDVVIDPPEHQLERLHESLFVLGAGCVVVSPQGCIVVVSQGGITWSLPKGHVDPGESTITAAVRETYEETGIAMADLHAPTLLGRYERYRGTKDGGDDHRSWKTLTFYRVTVEHEYPLHPIDSANPEALWVTIDEALVKLSHPADRAFLASVRNRL